MVGCGVNHLALLRDSPRGSLHGHRICETRNDHHGFFADSALVVRSRIVSGGEASWVSRLI